MNRHPDDRQLNEYADDTLVAREHDTVHDHVIRCAACGEAVERIRRLRADLAAMPRSAQPSAHVLAGIHTEMAGGEKGVGRDAHEPPWYARPRMLAAAAVILIALSSSVTALMLRAPTAERAADAAVTPPRHAAALLAVDAMERSYEDAIAEVQRALLEGQSGLSPETVRVLETNLALIDRALTEARTALRADPGNDALTALLRSGYERKLDVLRSVSSHARARS